MSRTHCDKCGANRALAEYSNGSYCFSCKNTVLHKLPLVSFSKKRSYEFPKDLTQVLPSKVLEWLAQYYINKQNCEEYGICWSDSFQRIVFVGPSIDKPFAWLRSINKEITPKWLFVGNKETPYFLRTKCKEHNKELVIVEDVISAIRISNYSNVLALGGTNFNTQADSLVPLFLKHKELVIWLDGDSAGVTAADKFRKRFKLLRPIKIIRSLKDPKCHNPREIEGILINDRNNTIKSIEL